MTIVWERSGSGYYATIGEPTSAVRFHLVVEAAGDQWDWVVWRRGEDQQTAQDGIAATVQDAMREAESVTG